MQIKIKHYNNRHLRNSFKTTLFSKNKHIPLYSAFFLLSYDNILYQIWSYEVRCSNQHKVCRKNISSLLPCQMNAFFFQRLPEHFQNTSRKLRQLIQKKDTSMRKCCFSRRWDSSASDERCPRHSMMDLPERSLPNQRILSFKQSRRAVNPRDLQTFFTVKRW